MNIWGLELRLKRARDMLIELNNKLQGLLRRRNKDWDEIEKLNFKIKKVMIGMSNLRNKIRELKNVKRKT